MDFRNNPFQEIVVIFSRCFSLSQWEKLNGLLGARKAGTKKLIVLINKKKKKVVTRVYRERLCISFFFFFNYPRGVSGTRALTNLTEAYQGLARFYNVFLVIYTLQQRAHECLILTRRLSYACNKTLPPRSVTLKSSRVILVNQLFLFNDP